MHQSKLGLTVLFKLRDISKFAKALNNTVYVEQVVMYEGISRNFRKRSENHLVLGKPTKIILKTVNLVHFGCFQRFL